MTERKGNLSQAGQSIPTVLEKYKLLYPLRFYMAKRDWEQIVGKQVAKYSYIKEMDRHEVVIGVTNSIWMNQLFIIQQDIQDKLNAYIGTDFVHSVRFVKAGRKPLPPVFQEEKKENALQKNLHTAIRNIVLSDEFVASVKEQTEGIKEPLRSKIRAARYASEKNRLAHEAAGYRICPQCGRWLEEWETLCLFCRRKAWQEKIRWAYSILKEQPWLTLAQFGEAGNVAINKEVEDVYNEVRRDCIYKLIDKIYYDTDTPVDDILLTLYITRKTPSELTDDLIRNLTNRYRKKENKGKEEGKNHVSAHRRQPDD